MITNQDRSAVRRIFAKVADELRPTVEAKARELGTSLDERMVKVMVAQNTLRICLEVALDECIPYDVAFLGELGVRLAAYSLSAAPVEDHASLVAQVAAALPATLEAKVLAGAVIRAEWDRGGTVGLNIPRKGDLQ